MVGLAGFGIDSEKTLHAMPNWKSRSQRELSQRAHRPHVSFPSDAGVVPFDMYTLTLFDRLFFLLLLPLLVNLLFIAKVKLLNAAR